MPLVAVTSSKVPLPRLRNSQQVSPRYASGVQYDFCLPSRLQKTSAVGRPPHVVADEQVEQAVAVEVEPHGRRAQGRASAEPARARHVHERALAGVAEQAVLSDAGDQDVGIAVVVEVADGGAHAVQLHIEAGAARDIGERAVAVVAVQAERRAPARVARPIHAVDEQDVRPAVGVVVDEGAAGPERFGQQLAAIGAAVVLELKAGRRGDIGQPEGERRRRAAGRGGRAAAPGAALDLPIAAAAPVSEELAPVHGSVTRPW